MPQQRRKMPFSGKKKKDQLLQKRQMKASSMHKHLNTSNESHDDGDTTEDYLTEHASKKIMEQPSGSRNKNVNRYNLQFYQESKKDLEQIKLEGYKPFDAVTPKQREIDARYFDKYDFPVRPPWSHEMNKEVLERNENRYFKEYVDNLQKLHKDDGHEFSLFELNLETWRQLWRVLELSDVLLIIVDVRYSTLMFPPSLYKYIGETIKKHAILVLNKVDIVTPEVVVAWRHYFQQTYPGIPIVLFASYPARVLKGTARGRMGHKRSMEGVYNIYRECRKLVPTEVNMMTWEEKILEDMRVENISFDDDLETKNDKNVNILKESIAHPRDEQEHVMFRDGILTVGCIGFPNVGKSSLINALKGRKVVSVSRTPGHTKHFQTIFLTNTVRLCDCPGLVFPSSTPKYLQVLLGSFPIAQLQVPYRSLKFVAEHLNVPQLLKLHLPEDYDEWSAVAVSDAWALKRGFLTAKAARPDRYRAANHLLRMCLVGQQQLILQFYPPGFNDQREMWLHHSEVEEVKKYQNAEPTEKDSNEDTSSVNSDSDNSDDISSSNDETNADDEDDPKTIPKTKNLFAVLDVE